MRPLTLALLSLTVLLSAPYAPEPAPVPRAVALAQTARDSMGAIFTRFNEHWNELGDLNTLERMLGTVRPTQREYLGCLQGRVSGDTVWVDGWVPANRMRQLQLAVAGDCDSIPRLVGTWHTHPYHADLNNLPVKERRLSAQDLETFGASPYVATLVVWDVDSIDAATKRGGAVTHPAQLVVRREDASEDARQAVRPGPPPGARSGNRRPLVPSGSR